MVTLHLYGRNDVTLGHYIEHVCLDPKFRCSRPGCDLPAEKHIRSFAHAEGRVIIGYEKEGVGEL